MRIKVIVYPLKVKNGNISLNCREDIRTKAIVYLVYFSVFTRMASLYTNGLATVSVPSVFHSLRNTVFPDQVFPCHQVLITLSAM